MFKTMHKITMKIKKLCLDCTPRQLIWHLYLYKEVFKSLKLLKKKISLIIIKKRYVFHAVFFFCYFTTELEKNILFHISIEVVICIMHIIHIVYGV